MEENKTRFNKIKDFIWENFLTVLMAASIVCVLITAAVMKIMSVNAEYTQKNEDGQTDALIQQEDEGSALTSDVDGTDAVGSYAYEENRENDSNTDETGDEQKIYGDGINESATSETETGENADTDEAPGPAEVPYDTYTPVETDSPYYSDAGLIPHTMEAEFTTVGDDYFDDSAWIGDSRCMGVADYSGWENADFYCENGFCAYDFMKGKPVKLQKKGTTLTVEEALASKKYSKVYIMLGINDCGYGNTETFKEDYQKLIDTVRSLEPDSVIYLVANLHISLEAQQEGGVFNNININDKNVAISQCADGERIIYLDMNDLFTDENGYLRQELTFDGYHLYAEGYMELTEFFKEHALAEGEEGE